MRGPFAQADPAGLCDVTSREAMGAPTEAVPIGARHPRDYAPGVLPRSPDTTRRDRPKSPPMDDENTLKLGVDLDWRPPTPRPFFTPAAHAAGHDQSLRCVAALHTALPTTCCRGAGGRRWTSEFQPPSSRGRGLQFALRATAQGERSITREPEKAAIEFRGHKEDLKKNFRYV